MKTATSEMLIDRTVNPISFAPDQRRLQRRHSLFEMTRDVFDDDDRIVHDEARRDRQRHQRQVVETVATQIHHAERADQRNGNATRGNKCSPRVPQEDKYHQNYQSDRDDQRAFHVIHRRADSCCLVQHDREIDRRRDRGFQLRHSCADAVNCVDDIRARLAEDDDQSARFSICQSRRSQVLD